MLKDAISHYIYVNVPARPRSLRRTTIRIDNKIMHYIICNLSLYVCKYVYYIIIIIIIVAFLICDALAAGPPHPSPNDNNNNNKKKKKNDTTTNNNNNNNNNNNSCKHNNNNNDNTKNNIRIRGQFTYELNNIQKKKVRCVLLVWHKLNYIK